MSETGKISIGEKIRHLREARGLKQKDLAQALDIDESAVSLLESGARGIKGEEIPKLYNALNCTASELFGDEQLPLINESSVLTRMVNEFSPDVQAEFGEILDRLGRQTKNLIELESTMGINPVNDIFRVRFTVPKNIGERKEQAGALAQEVRRRWDLGGDPIHNLEDILEQHSVIWARWQFPEELSGLCAPYGDRVVILVNMDNVGYRQKFSLGHELCHAIADIDKCVVLTRKGRERNGRTNYYYMEHRADLFAGKLLMPLASAHNFADQNGFELSDLTGKSAMQLAYFFGISGDAVLTTLVHYGILSWDSRGKLLENITTLSETGTPKRNPLEEWCDKTATDIQSLPRLVKLGFKAWFGGLINEGALRELLDIDRSNLR